MYDGQRARYRGALRYRVRTTSPRRKRWVWATLPIGVLTVGIVAAQAFTIRTVEVSGAGALVPHAAVRDAAYPIIRSHRFGVIPRGNLLTVGARSLARTLRAHFAFASVGVARAWGQRTLRITVTEQAIRGAVEYAGGSAVFVDGHGRVIGPRTDTLWAALQEGGGPRIPLVQFPGGPETKDGLGSAITPETLEVVGAAWELLRSDGAPLGAPTTVIPRLGDQHAFELMTARGVRVSLTAAEPGPAQVAKLRAVLRDPAFRVRAADIRSVDVRYGDRVYVQ